MDIRDILLRSLCGYVFLIPGIVLYFLYLRKTVRRQRCLLKAAVFVFGYYLIGVLTVTGIGYTRLSAFAPRFALTPFLDMIRGPVDTILKVILFVLLGIFLPMLYKKCRNIRSAVSVGFLISLAVETVQMFEWGTTDINDLLTNTLGTCLG